MDLHERRAIREARAVEVIKSIRPPPPEPYTGKLSPREIELMEILDQPSHIYFVYSAGRVKIGYSTNWRSRVDAVCQGCPHHAELILVMPGDMKMERGYQALFHEYHESGEWFRCDGKMREFLQHFSSEVGRDALEMAEAHFAELNAPESTVSRGDR